jgi:hypothetical protein
MFFLTEEQVEFIRRDIRDKGIEIKSLEDDLLDHICCAVEDKINSNINFQDAYDSTIISFGPKGLKEVQDEIINLLTYKNYYAMKTSINISGFSSAIILFFGSLFKLMHWPGANILLVVGISLFSFVFLPLLFILQMKETEKRLNKVFQLSIFFFGFFLSLGVMFKLMHWPGANMLLKYAGGILLFVYLPLAVYTMIKNPEQKTNTLKTMVFFVVGFCLFFALVRVHTSEHILNSFAIMDFNLNKSSNEISSKNQVIFDLIEQAHTDRKISDEDLQKAQKIKSLAVDLSEYLENLKAHLIKETEEIPESEAKNKNLLLIDYAAKTNFDIPTQILIGDPENPQPTQYSALELEQKIKQFRGDVLMAYDEDMRLKMENKIGLTTEDFPPINNITYTWSYGNFDHVPLVGVIPILSQIKVNVKHAESEFLLYLLSKKN